MFVINENALRVFLQDLRYVSTLLYNLFVANKIVKDGEKCIERIVCMCLNIKNIDFSFIKKKKKKKCRVEIASKHYFITDY